MKPNPPEDTAWTVSKSHEEPAANMRHFQRCVCEMKQLSFAGCERSADETGVGGFSTLGRVKCWGGLGAFWGGLWGWLMGAVEGFLMGCGLSAVGGAVCSA